MFVNPRKSVFFIVFKIKTPEKPEIRTKFYEHSNLVKIMLNSNVFAELKSI